LLRVLYELKKKGSFMWDHVRAFVCLPTSDLLSASKPLVGYLLNSVEETCAECYWLFVTMRVGEGKAVLSLW